MGSFTTSEVRNSLADQWLELSALTTRAPGSIPDQGTKILHVVHMAKRKKKVTAVDGVDSGEVAAKPHVYQRNFRYF